VDINTVFMLDVVFPLPAVDTASIK